jgi:hypothetical protein
MTTIANPAPRLVPEVLTARILAILVPVAYALGAAARVFGTSIDSTRWRALGAGLIVLALLAFAGLAFTSLRRVLTANEAALDERERQLRHRAFGAAHQTLVTVLATAFVYLLLAQGLGMWVPASAAEWQGVVFGLLLAAAALPTLHLAFALPLHVDDDELDGADPAARSRVLSQQVNRTLYGLGVLMGLYYLATQRPSDAMSMLGVALIFDPFDPTVPFPKRSLAQRAWLLLHLAAVLVLAVVSFAPSLRDLLGAAMPTLGGSLAIHL